MFTPRNGFPVAALMGSPQVIKSRDERDQGATPASNAAAIRSDASLKVMDVSPVVVVFTADEGASGHWREEREPGTPAWPDCIRGCPTRT